MVKDTGLNPFSYGTNPKGSVTNPRTVTALMHITLSTGCTQVTQHDKSMT